MQEIKKILAVFDNRWLNAQEVIWAPFVLSRQHFFAIKEDSAQSLAQKNKLVIAYIFK